MESTQMHHVLGISDKRSEEISKEVTAALVRKFGAVTVRAALKEARRRDA